SVRGMGVADMVRTSTCLRICLSRSLCRTPKRCSSSTTSRPRSANFTSFEIRRWVPIRISTLTASTFCRISFCCFGERKRLIISMATGKAAKRCLNVSVLEGKDSGGREHRNLLVVADGLEGGAHGDFRLAIAHVSAQQAVHGLGRFHVTLDVIDGG